MKLISKPNELEYELPLEIGIPEIPVVDRGDPVLKLSPKFFLYLITPFLLKKTLSGRPSPSMSISCDFPNVSFSEYV
ncbi:hypothetical protein D3C87_1115640 [compost metagenome]